MTEPELCIAVVDDEEPIRVMLDRMLRTEGYAVTSFESGEAFLASLVESTPACVLLDVHMPGLSGFDAQARLHAMNAHIPAIFITASNEAGLEKTARDVHGSALLRKPFSTEMLLDALRAALSSTR